MKMKRTCHDCGVYADGTSDQYYMLRHKIWALTGLGMDGGLLCLVCAEKRIGRPLQCRDFMPCRSYQRVTWGAARMYPRGWKAHLKARRTS